jgi:hypothetical protein
LQLRDGLVFMDVMMYVSMVANRSRKAGEVFESPEAEISISELALFSGAEERSINRTLDYMVTRKLAIVVRLVSGKRPTGKAVVRFVFTPEKIGKTHFPGWTEEAKTPYKEWLKLHPEFNKKSEESPQDDADAHDESEEMPVRPGTVRLTREPLTVRRGHKSRSIPVKCGVKSVRMDWEARSLDLQFSAVVDSGELVISGSLPDEQTERRKQDAKPSESVTSDDSLGHGRPRHPANEGSRHPANEVTHPRAEELAKVFDPLCYRHCERTLSAESKYFDSACSNIGDTPHDFLVKAAIARGARRLEPHHVPALCSQIQKDWKASDTLHGPTKLPTRAEIDAMIERERRELAEKRRALRRTK